MSFFKDIEHAASSAAREIGRAAEKTAKAIVEAEGEVEKGVNQAVKELVRDAEAVADAVAYAEGEVEEGVSQAVKELVRDAEAAADAVAYAEGEVEKGVTQVANMVADTAVYVGEETGRFAESAWTAVSHEGAAIAKAVEAAGIVVEKGFISGAHFACDVLEEAAIQTEKGLVATGKYLSNSVCDIAVGSALATVVVALALDGEEEVGFASLAAICAADVIDKGLVRTTARALASMLVEPVYVIPGVADALGHKEDARTLITMLITKACDAKPKLVIATAGQFLAGVLVAGLTLAICDGKLPGDLELWRGAQSYIT